MGPPHQMHRKVTGPVHTVSGQLPALEIFRGSACCLISYQLVQCSKTLREYAVVNAGGVGGGQWMEQLQP